MTVPAVVVENLTIYQGEDFRKTWAFADASDGNVIYGEVRRWPGGPLLASFAGSATELAQSVVITMNSSATTKLKHSGYYDIFIDDGVGLHPFRSGKAIVKARVSQKSSDASYRTWGTLEFTPGLTWAEIENNFDSWDDLLI